MIYDGILKEYEGTLDAADIAVVFYSPHALEIKKLNIIEFLIL